MKQFGIWNRACDAQKIGFNDLQAIYWNYNEPQLYEEALHRGEGQLTDGGALAVETGHHTGRSAQDKYIVRDSETETHIWWNNNKAISQQQFDHLLADFLSHAAGHEVFVQDLYGGANPNYRIKVRVFTEKAWHSLFIRNLLIRPDISDLESFEPELTIIDLPSFNANPDHHGTRSETVIACDFTRKIVLIGGTSYAGEMKKSVFSLLNYLLPMQSVMPMHCSANVGNDGDTAVFFGLSGTGKTTLSADPARILLGDDEHGWGEDGIFNFEGGCYAKTIRLSAEAEPEIFATTKRFGTVLENVVIDEKTRIPNFDDGSKTENTRCAYPIHFIANASSTGEAGHPKNIIMLTADAFGVMPPIAKLTATQAMYHFLSGYTAKVAGTEKGILAPQATFSTCFGAPFMPRHPCEYGNLLRKLIHQHQVNCWLVNTGWTGGAYGIGRRMPIKATRALLNAALNGELEHVDFYTDSVFGFKVPLEVTGVETHILHPRKTWQNKAAFDAQAIKLVNMFAHNFTQFESYVDADVLASAPAIQIAAQ